MNASQLQLELEPSWNSIRRCHTRRDPIHRERDVVARTLFHGEGSAAS
jgi:hypothetical protein